MYIDTSCLVAYYTPEPQSDYVQRTLQATERRIISQLVQVEFISALRKKKRMGELSEKDANKTFNLFKNHIKDSVYNVISLEPENYTIAEFIIKTTNQPLRTLDALHLGCVYSESLPIFSFDDVLNTTAEELGLEVV